jgi:calcineurin-like phosphoesterase family protein
MIENWNSVVQPDDYIFHLGDFSAGAGKVPNGYEKLKKISKVLNGEKHLIRGNHDHYTDEQYKKDLGFASVHDYILYKNLFLCHYPLIIDNYTKPEMIPYFNDMKTLFKQSGADYLVHGHSHKKQYKGKRINTAVDCNNFTPISLDDLILPKAEL